MTKQQHKAEDSVRQGAGLAMSRFHSVHEDINAVAEMMNSLNSPGAQAAFADTWLRKAAYTFETCWQIVYELARVILEEEVYLHPEWLREESFSSFKEYFETRFGRPFSVWLELEETYNLLREYKPDVIERIASYAQRMGESQKLQQAVVNQTVENVSGTKAKKPRSTHKFSHDEILKAQAQLREELGREPKHKEIADQVGLARSTVTIHLNTKSRSNTTETLTKEPAFEQSVADRTDAEGISTNKQRLMDKPVEMVSDGTTDSDYLTPVNNGETSLGSALVNAGLEVELFSVPDDPEAAAQALSRQFKGERRTQLIEILSNQPAE